MKECDVKLIGFDLDDTIYPEYEFVISGFYAVSKEMAIDIDIDENNLLSLMISKFRVSSRNVFDRVLSHFEINASKDLINKYVQIYIEHEPKICAYKDIKTSLALLKKKYKIALITDGNAVSQRNKIRVLGVEEFFDEIIFTDDYGKSFWKPSPYAFELLKQRTKIDYSCMVYVGDNPCKDFHIKNVYPVTTVRIKREGYTILKECENLVQSEFEIENMDQLISLLEKR